jgi:hypothetical protein
MIVQDHAGANILGDLSDLGLPFDKQSAIVSKLEAMLWP